MAAFALAPLDCFRWDLGAAAPFARFARSSLSTRGLLALLDDALLMIVTAPPSLELSLTAAVSDTAAEGARAAADAVVGTAADVTASMSRRGDGPDGSAARRAELGALLERARDRNEALVELGE